MDRADSALGPLIKDLGLEESLRLYRIKQSWKVIIGEPFAIHAAPTVLKGGVLFINVSSPAWLQQAGYYKANMLEKLGRFGVTDIRLKLGRVEPVSPKKRIGEKKHLEEPDPELVEELLSSIEDEEIKEVVRRAVRKSLGHFPKKN